jgi:secreted trypsin-like serine protease
MQVSMPLVETVACRTRFTENNPPFTPAIAAGQICAGYEQPGKDSCNGDSGGPLVASDGAGVPYQTGVVSWGPSNCGGVPKPYGVYTRISAHAQWLRTKVGTLRTVDREAALKARGEAEQRAVLRDAVDELQANLGDGKAAIRLVNWDGKLFKAKLNSLYQFEIKSEVAGRLIVIDIDAVGKVTQIFPNRFVKSQDLLRIKAGETIKLPTRPRFDFDAFKADEPVGTGKLILAVVPDDFPVELTLDLETRAQQRKGFVPVADPVAYLVNVLQQIAAQATSRPAGTQSTATRLAYTVVDYDIVR